MQTLQVKVTACNGVRILVFASIVNSAYMMETRTLGRAGWKWKNDDFGFVESEIPVR